jgi:hypothetical protein
VVVLVRLPNPQRLDDALDLFHDHTWLSGGGKPAVTEEQLAEWLVVMRPWFEQEFAAPKRVKPTKSGPLLASSTVPLKLREAVLRRDSRMCQRCGKSIYGVRYGLQHRRPRQMGGSKRLHTMANLVVLCGWSVDPDTCTAWVEVEDRPAATRDGWLVPNGADPEYWPVKRFDTTWEQPGEDWTATTPHPWQVEMGGVA